MADDWTDDDKADGWADKDVNLSPVAASGDCRPRQKRRRPTHTLNHADQLHDMDHYHAQRVRL